MHGSMRSFATLAAGGLALAGLAVAAAQTGGDRPDYSGATVGSLTAPLIDGSGAVIGSVQMWEDSNGVVKLFVGASGLTPGAHGVHIHAIGQCAGPAFTSAGGHYNPAGKKHGLESPDGHHAGDLPGLDVGPDGTTAYLTTTDDVTLTAGAKTIFDLDGSALVVHAGADDQVTDPTGNSGARVACALLADAAPGSIPTATPSATQSAPGAPNTGTGIAEDDGSGATKALWGALAGIAAAAAAAKLVIRRR